MVNRFISIVLLLALSAGKLSADGGFIVLDLARPTHPATFAMASNRIWAGTYSNDYPRLAFNNSIFSVTHLVDRDGFGSENEWGYWDGFTYSTDGDRTNYGAGSSQSWVAHQFGNMAGGGIKTDAAGNVMRKADGTIMADPDIPYLVGYWGYYKILFGTSDKQTLQVNLNKVYRAEGVYINNSPWPFYGNSGGDSFARPLNRDGDYFKLLIHGLDGNLADNGRTVEYYLARNTAGLLAQSPDWEWVDLSALGEIGGIYFTMESTDTDPVVGLNTAAYFCMDKLTLSEPAVSHPVAGVSLDRTEAELAPGELLQLTASVSPAAAENRSLTWTSSNEAVATVFSDGQVVAFAAGMAVITATTVEGGYTASCTVTVKNPSGTLHAAPLHAVYPNPFAQYIMVETRRATEASISNMSGRVVQKAKLAAGLNRIDTSTLPKGIYILTYDGYTTKLIKRYGL
ncbi:MAG: DUF4465 domain-containing protein [Tannerellaceae bacterium]|jgi:hypothetical protein|nr:DUF4465 domain-containing protein [Tannerellaceae bacterium]